MNACLVSFVQGESFTLLQYRESNLRGRNIGNWVWVLVNYSNSWIFCNFKLGLLDLSSGVLLKLLLDVYWKVILNPNFFDFVDESDLLRNLRFNTIAFTNEGEVCPVLASGDVHVQIGYPCTVRIRKASGIINFYWRDKKIGLFERQLLICNSSKKLRVEGFLLEIACRVAFDEGVFKGGSRSDFCSDLKCDERIDIHLWRRKLVK